MLSIEWFLLAITELVRKTNSLQCVFAHDQTWFTLPFHYQMIFLIIFLKNLLRMTLQVSGLIKWDVTCVFG